MVEETTRTKREKKKTSSKLKRRKKIRTKIKNNFFFQHQWTCLAGFWMTAFKHYYYLIPVIWFSFLIIGEIKGWWKHNTLLLFYFFIAHWEKDKQQQYCQKYIGSWAWVARVKRCAVTRKKKKKDRTGCSNFPVCVISDNIKIYVHM